MKKGQVYKITVGPLVTSNVFKKGHRIRVEIASSRFPRYARNLNTGGDNVSETEWVIARNTIHHSPDYPSSITLPIVPNK
jgi:putative CocE/NonD family hydrolase